jgi:hypothetical protein
MGEKRLKRLKEVTAAENTALYINTKFLETFKTVSGARETE